jgi:hypothetical protein
VENQFTVFETLHAQTCNVQGATCELSPVYWPSFAGLLALTALFAVYAFSGAASRVGEFAERRTSWLWLQAIIAAVPPGIAIITLLATFRGVAFATQSGKGPCRHSILNEDGTVVCLNGSEATWNAVIDAMTDGVWIVVPVAFVILVALIALRRAPKQLWLFPGLSLSLYIGVTSVMGNTPSPSQPLPLSNFLAETVKPLAEAESWSMARVFSTREVIVRNQDAARVVGLGPWQRIEFGHGWAHGIRDIAPVVTHNGWHVPDPSPAVIRAVMGHELAHIERRHLEVLLGLNLLLILTMSWLAFRLVCKSRLSADPWTHIPLYASALCIGFALVDASMLGAELATEYDADQVGLEISNEPDGFAEFALLSAAGSKLELGLLERWLVTQHPSNGERIRTAIAWQMANRANQPLSIPDTRRLFVPATRPYPAVGMQGK